MDAGGLLEGEEGVQSIPALPSLRATPGATTFGALRKLFRETGSPLPVFACRPAPKDSGAQCGATPASEEALAGHGSERFRNSWALVPACVRSSAASASCSARR